MSTNLAIHEVAVQPLQYRLRVETSCISGLKRIFKPYSWVSIIYAVCNPILGCYFTLVEILRHYLGGQSISLILLCSAVDLTSSRNNLVSSRCEGNAKINWGYIFSERPWLREGNESTIF